jgi:vesicle coat complex subunit
MGAKDHREHQTIEQRTREQVEAMLASADPRQIANALASAAYYDPDWRWVQGQCLFYLTHADVEVRRSAATCLGLLAVFHKKLDAAVVLPALKNAAADPEVKAWAEDALAEIEERSQAT